MTRGRSGGGSGTGRPLSVRLRRAKRRKASSSRWLQRQLNDPYVFEARRRGYRSRAAFKLAELDDRFGLLKPGDRVIDLGAAPGGWTQIAVARVGARGRVVAVDIAEMEAVPGAEVLRGDVFDPGLPERLLEALGGPAAVVLSDMAPPATGHAATDHLRILGLAEAAFEVAVEVLRPGGIFVAKVWQGGADSSLLDRVKKAFSRVRHAKPPASRKESAELYVIAQGFRGRD